MEQVMQWRLILEDFQSSKKIAEDALIRLDIVDTPIHVKNNIKQMQNQQKDRDLIKIVQTSKD